MLAQECIDAVVIATPDHWHVPIALAAVNAAKDVYVEKPLGVSIREDQAMRDAIRKTGTTITSILSSASRRGCRASAR
ncbi:Gfo/Idh/MocA family oxidoreductase [candidate division KSB1 bacterium]|nr:Gfo/Idh/MocA family oxidoreductase [candidate division KSB1 bacterium]